MISPLPRLRTGLSRRRGLVLAAVLAVPAVAVAIAVWLTAGDDGCDLGPPGCAPDPGGDEAARVPLPPPGVPFGFNENPTVDGIPQGELEQLALRAGATARRFPLDWRLLEPARDAWDEAWWGRYEKAYRAILAAGMTPVINFGFAPVWAREPGAPQACTDPNLCRYPPAPAMDAEWAEFSAEVARRFPEAVLEVWNEPNLAIFWRPTPDPERFGELMAIAHRQIKRADPSITVLAGGLAPNPEPSGPLGPDGPVAISLSEFLDRAYEAEPGIAGRMDALSFHPYPYGAALGAGTLFAQAFADAREVTARHGDAGIELWVTETGIPTSGQPYAVTEAEQADLLLRLYRRLATMPDVGAILIHRLLPPPALPPGSSEPGHALLRAGPPPVAPKPAFCALAAEAGNPYPGC
ncbi:MAG: hypothetical protein ACR2G3_13035 [Solirubrobacterales bacterium]